MAVEFSLMQVFYALRQPFLNELFAEITALGSAVFAIILITGMFLSGKRDLAKNTAASYGLMTAIVYPIKFLVDRPRPDISGQLVHATTQHSFPSGHTAGAFVLATMLSYEKEELKYFFFGLAALVGFSRVYLGVHFPSDVIVGGLIGYGAGKIVLKYQHKIGSLIRMGDNS